MGRVVVTGSIGNINRRLAAIILRLEYPEDFLVRQARKLAELVEANAPRSAYSTGRLASAFQHYVLYKTAAGRGVKGYNAVGIGDPKVLTKPAPIAGAGFIKEFIEWLRLENGKKYGAYQKLQKRGVAQRQKLRGQIREAKRHVRTIERRKVTAAKAARKQAKAKIEPKFIREHIRAMVEEILEFPGVHGRGGAVSRVMGERVATIQTLMKQVPRARRSRVVTEALKYWKTHMPKETLGLGEWKVSVYYVRYIFGKARGK